MSEDKEKIIDLTFSSPLSLPEADSSPATGNKRAHTALESGSRSHLSEPIPTIDELASQFYTRDGLHRHLMSISSATLSKMLLSQVQEHQFRPRPQIPKSAKRHRIQQNSSNHCIYCHKAYDVRQNQGCRVEHFGELEDLDRYGHEKAWTCCGGEVSYADYGSGPYTDLVNGVLYCYVGRHWAEEIEHGDGQEGKWWEEWNSSKKTCADIGCFGV